MSSATDGGFADVPGAEHLVERAAEVESQSRLLDKGQRQRWLSRADRLIASGEVEVHGPLGLGLHVPSAQVREFAQGYMVQYQLQGSAVVEPSTLTVFFDKEGALSGATQILLRDLGLSSAGRLTLWSDGALQRDIIVDELGAVEPYSAEGAAAKDEVITAQWSWSKFKDCLNRQGVSAWVVTAISISCGVVCAVSFGTLCAACVAAAGSVTATTIFYCARTS
ncbi:hypothetical protein [Intrasporangium calvum]|uniref:Uncharacterized protein n=1 Tax=Intrasporangium calvum (strain ATCC 23552 / DSM 43043 / JCM 3097 / NBRC 12989 / NCIMB 10167 / NRRL B-3866 / 7 KIP) TaxID=710696 RepID=E6SF71_INTC7|nr:hypothetical protein [Intrasporangium calvum]ADU49885.1 hypothetical protein Intca_3405 [Intrasporangium calvum DSM 43043]